MPHFEYNQSLGAARTDVFGYLYPLLNKEIVDNGIVRPSRNGTVREILNFKTVITDPYFRCVGGFNRNVNIFFLLAEAIWIVRGRNDVAWLKLFNTQMAEYSDDGAIFHAPYGQRLRAHGTTAAKGDPKSNGSLDQLLMALHMLDKNPDDRRVTLNIWNPLMDLGTDSKDIPCNDQLMFKIRDGKLYQTIQNRSNDLHWGLPTNVFQFSFIGELMTRILTRKGGSTITLGDQVHNSQSLHIYTDNITAENMYRHYLNTNRQNLYDITDKTISMDFNFASVDVGLRLEEIDLRLDSIFEMVLRISKNIMMEVPKDEYLLQTREFVAELKGFSLFLAFLTELLIIYVEYSTSPRGDYERLCAINDILSLRNVEEYESRETDYEYLALNFFFARLKNIDSQGFERVNKCDGTL